MLVVKERRAAFRTIEGWAISVPLEVGAIQECEEHGWMRDRAEPTCQGARRRHRSGGPSARRLSGEGESGR